MPMRVKDDVRGVTPVADADGKVRSVPSVVPLLLGRRLEVGRLDLDSELPKTAVEKLPLGGKPAGRGGILVEDEQLKSSPPFGPKASDAVSGSAKVQNASTVGVARTSQLSGPKP